MSRDMDKDSHRIGEQAAEYVARRPKEASDERRQREAWLSEDPRHARAYDQALRMDDLAADLLEALDRDGLRAHDEAALRRRRRLRPGWMMAVAATLTIVMVSVVYIAVPTSGPTTELAYATALGERRSEALEDGTRLVLNTDSALHARYTRARREVELQRGEAQFDVAHDARRPFVVKVAGSTVTALGTRFQVRREAGIATVTLLDGRVEVAHGGQLRELRPNEQAQLSVAGMVVQPVDLDQASGWVEGWLHFRNAPLREVVDEANRYATRKLRLGAPELADLEVSASFHAGDSETIAASVALILPVRVDNSGADIVLLPR
ncbi:FecR domain-containing protein [Luteimonas sp. BDR2-5]|uniref:FecR family protein n=1 Tax=Proluteimonas luteida TaxID=2878685 RepID=UPI001E515E2D|nr:FecR domain-containing protein [Luteimonas sp. BDR2-5]MCD9026774.1 FecR domain-containing protein [Luteimonas sp. BDR2-5]